MSSSVLISKIKEPCSLTAGMYYVIPSNVPHGTTAPVDCKVIDVFNPVREDYKTT